MKLKKASQLLTLFGVITILLVGTSLLQQRALLLADSGETVSNLTNQEIIYNGGFEVTGSSNAPIGWKILPAASGSGVKPNGGPDNSSAMQIQGITVQQVALFQELMLPSNASAVNVSFNYRLTVSDYYQGGDGSLWARVITDTGTIVTMLNYQAYQTDSGWLNASVDLDANAIASIQQAHSAGQNIYIIFDLLQDSGNSFYGYLDNVSVKVSGTKTDLPTTGSIAYVGSDGNGYPYTVKRIEPDGSGDTVVWTHPDGASAVNSLYDVAWKPDGTELGFTSDFEDGYSAFQADIFAMYPDGSHVRRVSNPPAKADLAAGTGYQFGTVTGKIMNNYGNGVAPFLVYIQGAKEPVTVSLGNYGETVNFTVPNVADLGNGHLPYVVFAWGSTGCANGREYAPGAIVDVQAGQTVDAGTLQFNGTCGKYQATQMTWKRDSSDVAADVITPRKFAAAGEAIGSDLFTVNNIFAGNPDWSPINDQVLYHIWDSSPTAGIYLTTAGGGSGTQLLNTNGSTFVTPVWLPDGSGFVYTNDHYVLEYRLQNQQTITLANLYDDWAHNPSVSPDGRYVVFEWQRPISPTYQSDLWVLDRQNPVDRWQLTRNGQSSNPNWSRVEPGNPTGPTPTATTTQPGPTATATQPGPTATPTPTATSTPASTPKLSVNYSSGNPGSKFVVTGQNMSRAMVGSGDVKVNGVSVGTVNWAGNDVIFTLATDGAAAEGPYLVDVGGLAVTQYTLSNSAANHTDTQGVELNVPHTILAGKNIYLPLILRNS